MLCFLELSYLYIWMYILLTISSILNRWSWNFKINTSTLKISNLLWILKTYMDERLYAIPLYSTPKFTHCSNDDRSTWHINFSAHCAYNMNCFLIIFFSLPNVTITEENTTNRNCTGFFLILNKLQAVLNYLHFVNTKDWRMYFTMKGLKHKLLDNEIKF